MIFKLLIDYLIERGLIAVRNFSFWKVWGPMQRDKLLRYVLRTYSGSRQTDREQLTRVRCPSFTLHSLRRLLLELISQPHFIWLYLIYKSYVEERITTPYNCWSCLCTALWNSYFFAESYSQYPFPSLSTTPAAAAELYFNQFSPFLLPSSKYKPSIRANYGRQMTWSE